MRQSLRFVPAVLLFASAAGLAQAPGASPAAPPPGGYSGHGAESVPAEVIAKFAPPALPAPLAAKIQMLADVRSPLGGHLSPDGQKLYFVWNVTGVPQVWRLDGPNTFPIQMTGGEERTSVAGITPDGKTLVLSRDRMGEENPGLYTMPASGGPLTTIQRLPGVQTSFAFISDHGKWVTFRSNDVKRDSYRILRYEFATGNKEVVFDEPGLWGVADHRPDGRLLLHRSTGSQTGEYWEWDPVKKTKTPLLGQGDKEELRASYGKREGELIVVTAKFGDFRRAYRWENGKFEPITPELKWNVERTHLDRSKTRLFYTVNEGGTTGRTSSTPRRTRSCRSRSSPRATPSASAAPPRTAGSPPSRSRRPGRPASRGSTTGRRRS